MDKRIGNQFWKLRKTHGKPRIFATAEDLWGEACKYFAWADENPLEEEKAFSTGDRATLNRMRAYTIHGLLFFLNIGKATWEDYEARPEFKEVVESIQQVIFTQKFEGAAAGLLNANIISRELGLIDKQQMEVTPGSKQKDYSNLSDDDLKQLTAIEQKLINAQ